VIAVAVWLFLQQEQHTSGMLQECRRHASPGGLERPFVNFLKACAGICVQQHQASPTPVPLLLLLL